MYVLDSSALIELFENTPRANQVIQTVGDSELCTTSICVHELLAGKKTEKQLFILQGLLKQMRVFDHDLHSAKASAETARTLQNKGAMINAYDILIAGICLTNNATLVTFDSDFEKVARLQKVILQ